MLKAHQFMLSQQFHVLTRRASLLMDLKCKYCFAAQVNSGFPETTSEFLSLGYSYVCS